MKNKRILVGLSFAFVVIFTLSFVSAYISSNVQYSQYTPSSSETLSKEVCQQGQDFLIQISPFGCTPAVVRTDLLEETDVPVYCQLGATKLNPLIEVEAIDSISFSGTYPKEVSGIGFHPAKAALGVTNNLNSPVLNNIGYVVLMLKKQSNASAIPDFVSGTLTAKIKYNLNNAFGIGKAFFYLPQLTDDEWEAKQYQYSFWSGRGSLRVDNIEANSADVSLYSNDVKISEVNLEKGKTSESISLPGFTCQAGLKLKLDGLENPNTRAKLRVNAEVVEVAKGEKFLDNKCQVQNLNKYGLVQKVSLKCQEDTGSKNLDLTIGPKVVLNIDGVDKEVGLGDWLYGGTAIDGNRNVYLGYIGANGDSGKTEDLYVYLFSTPQFATVSDEKLSSISSLVGVLIDAKATSSGFVSQLSDVIKKIVGFFIGTGRFLSLGEDLHRINFADKNQKDIFLGNSISIVGFAGAQDIELTGTALENYQNAKNDYDSIRESYSSEKFTDGTTSTFGEEALYKEIVLAWDASQKKTAQELCQEFEQNYPKSKKVLNSYCKNDYQSSNTEISSVYALINKQTRQISFDGIYEPSFDEYGVTVLITTSSGTQSFDLRKNQIQYLGDSTIPSGTDSTGGVSGGGGGGGGGGGWGSTTNTTSTVSSTTNVPFSSTDYIQLISINDNSAEIRTSISAAGIAANIQKDFSSDIVKLTLDSTRVLGEGYSFTLSKINLKKSAKVSVIPNIDNAGTQANFSFKIGIEKRAVSLPPEKVKQMISDLDKEIKQWDDISNTLNGTITTLKKACVVTGAVLVATNFIANAGGTGIARKTVMRGTDGWYEKCADEVAKGTYSSQEQCFTENSDKIDKDVEKLSSLITAQNSKIKQLESGITTQKFLTDNVVDTDAFMQKYAPQVSSSLNNLPGENINDPSGKGNPISKVAIISVLSYQSYKEGKYSTEQLRNVELYTNILSDGSSSTELKEIAKTRLYSELTNINTNAQTYSQVSTWAGGLGVSSNKISTIEIQKNTKAIQYQGLTNADLGAKKIAGFSDNTPIALVQTVPDGKQYILVLDNSVGTARYTIKNLGNNQLAIYDSLGILSITPPAELKTIYFEKVDALSYKNSYKNAKLRYYETDPYKGMPAIVPFDLNNGWYAATKQTLPTGGNIQSYDASARVNSFYLCNIGSNGLEEFQNIGDDTCEMINTGTGQSYNQFPGLSETESKSLINKAVKAIEQASKMYKSGLSGKVKILDSNVDVGSPAVNIPDYECQDFMSPKECSLLFNLCDPVICPSSRCDLGGAYPVSDVVQSGIIGSLVLCLPNINEGIILPVCLTGLKAGIDGFVSVKQSYKDCLQESLNTGKLVGICDEIYSIYMCDFFWRQALPLADMVIPKIVEVVVGQNIKGGGEYLSVSNAWSGAEQAVNYFVNSYGVNAKESFLKRSTEAVKGEVCKSFVSGVVPSSGDILDTLTAADSPAQFHGRFDETSLTTVTAPPTSHYKVFYHIYAGKDSGAYYKVYLKGSLDSSYYRDNAQSISVASGYVSVGGYATETKDFVATSGYKELCINVNGQEECGFKEVTTSFALNYIEDQYLSSQANTTGITAESECISGTASAYSLLNPNAQSAAEEMLNPEIYNEGIIRVCATSNPGLSTDPYVGTENSRWKQVGYCDNEKVKCWIDTKSVENVIKTTTVEGETLNGVTQSYLDVLSNEGGYLTKEQFSSAIKEIEDTTDSSTKITMAGNILNKSFWSSEKVQLLYLRGNAYADLFRVLFAQMPKPVTTDVITTTTSSTSDLGQRVLAAAARLDGTDASKYYLATEQNVAEDSVSCWNGAYHVYLQAGVDVGCVYGDPNGVKYTFSSKSTDDQTRTIVIGVTKREGEKNPTFIPASSSACKSNPSNTNSQQKLDNIQPGYLLSVVSDSQWGHNVIFIKWMDKANGIAQLFDWNGQGSNNGKIFRYFEWDISDDSHPVYTYWKPVIYGQGTSKTSATCSLPPTTSGDTTIGGKIATEANKLVGSYKTSIGLVNQSLTNAGVSITGSSADSFISSIKGNSNFVEVDVNSGLKRGDIILLGNFCSKTSMGIFSGINSANSNLEYYGANTLTNTVEDEVKIKTLFTTGIGGRNTYAYAAYRYVGDYSVSEKAAVKTRAKWTTASALTKVNTLLTTSGKTNGGKYSDNKDFSDQLVFDDVLTKNQCATLVGVNTLFGLINSEKDMNWLKKTLLENQATSGQAESVSAD